MKRTKTSIGKEEKSWPARRSAAVAAVARTESWWLVAGGQKHEVRYTAKKAGVKGKAVKKAVKRVGNGSQESRRRAEESLAKHSWAGMIVTLAQNLSAEGVVNLLLAYVERNFVRLTARGDRCHCACQSSFPRSARWRARASNCDESSVGI